MLHIITISLFLKVSTYTWIYVMIEYIKKEMCLPACSAIFQNDKHSNNYLLFLGDNSTWKPSNVLFP